MSKFEIKVCGGEQEILEGCLNLASSGNDPTLVLAFVALGLGWHVDQLIHYQDLIWEAKTSFTGSGKR